MRRQVIIPPHLPPPSTSRRPPVAFRRGLRSPLPENNATFQYDIIYALILCSDIILLNTREIPAFGGISLTLWGSGTLGATFGRLRHPSWGTPGAHLGNRHLRRR